MRPGAADGRRRDGRGERGRALHHTTHNGLAKLAVGVQHARRSSCEGGVSGEIRYGDVAAVEIDIGLIVAWA